MIKLTKTNGESILLHYKTILRVEKKLAKNALIGILAGDDGTIVDLGTHSILVKESVDQVWRLVEDDKENNQ
jgi:uncharacterized protein YlzI (FlbEa/FlbD family)